MNAASWTRLRSLEGSAFTRAFLAVAVAGCLLSWGPGLGYEFTGADVHAARDNPAIRSLANIGRFLVDPFVLSTRADGVDLRPAVAVANAVNAAATGVVPWGFRLANLALHLLSGLLVFLLVRDHLWWPEDERGADGEARWPAAAAALVFLLAPMNHQAVATVSGRPALLVTLFSLAWFWSLMNRRLGAAVFFQVLALLSDMTAVVLPGFFIAFDYLVRDRERHPGLRDWAADWADLLAPVTPMLVADVVFLAQRANAVPSWVGGLGVEPWVTPGTWFLSGWSVMLHHAASMVWPTGFAVSHAWPYTTALAEGRAGLSLVAILAWMGAALWASRRHPHVAFATFWAFLALAPDLTWFPRADLLVDHRPYLATSLGFAVLLAWLLRLAALRAGALGREVFVAAVLAWCALSAVTGLVQGRHARDEVSLWQRAVDVEPGNGAAWVGLAQAWLDAGDAKNARRVAERAKPMVPADADLHVVFCSLGLAEGRIDEALEAANQAVRFGPRLARTHACQARVLGAKRLAVEEAGAWKAAAALAPNDPGIAAALERVTRREADHPGEAGIPAGPADPAAPVEGGEAEEDEAPAAPLPEGGGEE